MPMRDKPLTITTVCRFVLPALLLAAALLFAGILPALADAPALPALPLQAQETATPEGGQPADEGGPIYHEVREGESLWSIAEVNNIDVYTLLSLNGITFETVLQPGEKLLVRLAFTPTLLPANTPTPVVTVHTPTPDISPTPTPQPLGERVEERMNPTTLIVIIALLLAAVALLLLSTWASRKAR